MGNIWKTGILMALLTILLIFIGRLIGGTQGAVFAFAFALLINFVAYWFSDKIVLGMYGGKEVSAEQSPELYGIVQNLAGSMGLPMPRVYVIPAPSPNAFATGRNPQHSAVAVTEGSLRILNKQELEAVIAHELAHIKHRDTLIATVVAALAGAVTLLARIAGMSAFYGGRDEENRGGGAILLLVYLLAPLAALLIQLAISRSREYMADEGSARATRKPMNLASALKKLVEYTKQVPLPAEPSTAHMFIVNPFSGGGFTAMFSTHPPIEKRIERLEELARQLG